MVFVSLEKCLNSLLESSVYRKYYKRKKEAKYYYLVPYIFISLDKSIHKKIEGIREAILLLFSLSFFSFSSANPSKNLTSKHSWLKDSCFCIQVTLSPLVTAKRIWEKNFKITTNTSNQLRNNTMPCLDLVLDRSAVPWRPFGSFCSECD